jgi:hypothetical protein
MVRGTSGVSLRVLGREWTEVARHADPALAVGYSHPDHHLAGASLTPLVLRIKASACEITTTTERTMGLGRGLLLWILGIPLPIILLLALFWH